MQIVECNPIECIVYRLVAYFFHSAADATVFFKRSLVTGCFKRLGNHFYLKLQILLINTLMILILKCYQDYEIGCNEDKKYTANFRANF